MVLYFKNHTTLLDTQCEQHTGYIYMNWDDTCSSSSSSSSGGGGGGGGGGGSSSMYVCMYVYMSWKVTYLH